MSKKGDIQSLIDYVLSGGHEWDDFVSRADEYRLCGMTRKEIRESLTNHIYYTACKLQDGKREAGKQITEAIKEVM